MNLRKNINLIFNSLKWQIDQAKLWQMNKLYIEDLTNKYSSLYIRHMYPILKYEDAGFYTVNTKPWLN